MSITIGVIVNKGFEKVAVRQIREILEDVTDIRVEETIVIFKANTWDEVFRFVYKNQIANRVIYYMNEIEYKIDEELIDAVYPKLEDEFFNEQLINGVRGFRVTLRSDEHMDITWLEAEIGGKIIEYAKNNAKELKVNLTTPALNFYIHVYNNTAYFGIDLSDDLSKRDYKIFNNAVSLKGPTAFGLLMLAEYVVKDSYLNPQCYSGTIEIEAALYATNISHRFYNKSFPFMKFFDKDWDKVFKKLDSERVDKKFPITGSDPLLSSITAATKNAKIAGVESYIDFRRIDLDWMDIKYEEKSIDKIISFIPGSSKHDKHLVKGFKQIFYHAEYILKDSGVAIIMCLSKDLLIESSIEHFSLDHELSVNSGGQLMRVLFFKKK
jgi:23S rRNA G2445 N2-methylase RlmL